MTSAVPSWLVEGADGEIPRHSAQPLTCPSLSGLRMM